MLRPWGGNSQRILNRFWCDLLFLDARKVLLFPCVPVPGADSGKNSRIRQTEIAEEVEMKRTRCAVGLHVQVDQIEPRPWNFLVGGLWAMDERVHLIVEGGMGGREYVISGLMVRF